MRIKFYRANEKPYGVFNNLFRRQIVFEDTTFATAEDAYQASEARRPEVRARLMAPSSSALLAIAAHGLYQWDVTPSWSRTKFDRMRAVLLSEIYSTRRPALNQVRPASEFATLE